MEHYKSVFATAAIMVFGLVATSPLVRTQNSASVPPRAKSVIVTGAEAADGATWADPPRYGAGLAAASGAMERGEGDDAPSPKPATFTLLSPETVALLASDDLAGSDKAQRVQAVRRHRAAKIPARVRPASVDANATPAPIPHPEPTAVQPQKDARIDPIGDLLRGLGIGRDS